MLNAFSFLILKKEKKKNFTFAMVYRKRDLSRLRERKKKTERKTAA